MRIVKVKLYFIYISSKIYVKGMNEFFSSADDNVVDVSVDKRARVGRLFW